MAVVFDGRVGKGPNEWSPWRGVIEAPQSNPDVRFGSYDIITLADGTKAARFVIPATTADLTGIIKERVQLVRDQPTPSGVQWFGFDFELLAPFATTPIICQPLWQNNVLAAAPPALALKARPDSKGLFLTVQAGVGHSSIPGVYEFKSVDIGPRPTDNPGALWAIPPGRMDLGVTYQVKLGVNWSTRSPRNPLNQGAPDGWIKAMWRIKGSHVWIPSADAAGFATVRVNIDGTLPKFAQQTVEIYDLNHNPTRRELHSSGLYVATTEAEVDLVMGGITVPPDPDPVPDPCQAIRDELDAANKALMQAQNALMYAQIKMHEAELSLDFEWAEFLEDRAGPRKAWTQDQVWRHDNCGASRGGTPTNPTADSPYGLLLAYRAGGPRPDLGSTGTGARMVEHVTAWRRLQ